MKRRDGSWTNGGSKKKEREHRGRESVTVRREGGREGLWVAEVMGCSVFSSHACPCYLESLFPIYQGVRCGMQMEPVAACMCSTAQRPPGPPLNELTLKR